MIESKYIAIGLIWIGVGISALGRDGSAGVVAFFAMLATLVVAST